MEEKPKHRIGHSTDSRLHVSAHASLICFQLIQSNLIQRQRLAADPSWSLILSFARNFLACRDKILGDIVHASRQKKNFKFVDAPPSCSAWCRRQLTRSHLIHIVFWHHDLGMIPPCVNYFGQSRVIEKLLLQRFQRRIYKMQMAPNNQIELMNQAVHIPEPHISKVIVPAVNFQQAFGQHAQELQSLRLLVSSSIFRHTKYEQRSLWSITRFALVTAPANTGHPATGHPKLLRQGKGYDPFNSHPSLWCAARKLSRESSGKWYLCHVERDWLHQLLA